MTTPTTDNTAYSIICEAAWDACLVPHGEDPDSELIAKWLRRLNQMVMEMTTAEDGPKLWLLNNLPVTLTAGLGLYQFGPNLSPGPGITVMPVPKYLYHQYYQYSAANGSTRRPVFRIALTEYDDLSVTTQLGPITQIFVQPLQNQFNISTWLTPDANEALGTLQLWFRQQVTGFVEITDSMNFPVEWALALHWGLAWEICNGQPPAVIKFCMDKAAYYKQKLIDWDQEHETSIKLQPDQRLLQPSRFGRR